MASGKFVEQSNVVLDEWFGGVPVVKPTVWYMTLWSAVPNKNGGGTEITDDPDYPRIEVANDSDMWPAPVNGRKSNGEEIEMTQALDDLGQCVAAALVDTETGPFTYGVFGHLKTPVVIRNGQTRFFPVGAVQLIEA
jgi:hypothetical protein